MSGGTGVREVRISGREGRVQIDARSHDEIVLHGNAEVSVVDGVATVAEVRGRIALRVPEGTNLVVGTTTGRVDIRGRAGDVAVVTSSGRVVVADAASVDVRSRSGPVVVGQVRGECRIHNESGRVTVEGCTSAVVASRSGRIILSGARGPVRAHCVSGRIEITLLESADVDAETISGRVTVSLPRQARAYRQEGEPHGAVPEGFDCVVRARSVSGHVDVMTR
jgi:DUF4097 and DUF4098 domain-containing protein YvlB